MYVLNSHAMLAVVRDTDGPESVLAVLIILAIVALILRYIFSDATPAPRPPDFRPVKPPAALASRMDVLPEEHTPPRGTLEIDQVDMVLLRSPQER